MTVKDWLSRGYKINLEIKQLTIAKEKAKNLACNASANYSGERVQTSIKNTVEDKNINYSDYSIKLCKRINELLEIQKDIIKCISTLKSPVERALLYGRYLNSKTWEEISAETGYSMKQIQRIHDNALNKLELPKLD